MERQRPPVADGISRLLSTAAIVLAVVGAVYLYGENQKLKKDLTSLRELSDGSVAEAEYEKQIMVWNGKVDTAINEFIGDATKSLAEFDAARLARDDMHGEGVRVSEARVEAIVQQFLENDVVAMKPVVQPAELEVTHTVVKPIDGESVPVQIRNLGDLEAEIVSVEFTPIAGSQFETALPSEREEDQVVIRFSPDHNSATKANHHKLYRRTYLMPEQIVASNDTVEISVEIVRNRNVGWGMKGDLEVEYNDGQKLTIPSIDAIFVPEKVDT